MKNLLKVFFALSIITVFCFSFMPEQNSAKAISKLNLKTLSTGDDVGCMFSDKWGECRRDCGESVCAPMACEQ